MARISNFSNFVSERMGVPDGNQALADRLTDLIMEEYLSVRLSGEHFINMEREKELKFSREQIGPAADDPNMPVDSVSIDFKTMPQRVIRMNTKKSRRVPVACSAAFVKKYSDPSSLHNIKLKFQIIFLESATDEEVYQEVHDTMSHELTHAYEARMRARGDGHGYFDYLTTLERLTDTASHNIQFYGKNNVIRRILFMLYIRASYEIAANTVEAYSHVRNIKDPHERLAALEKTDQWAFAEEMRKFNAKRALNSLNKSEYGQTNIRLIIDTISIALNRMQKFVDKNPTTPNIDKIQSVIKRARPIVERFSKKSNEEFLQWCQKEFNAAGEDLHRRLSRLTTY